MKKLLTLLLTLFMVFTLVGCNSKQEEMSAIDEPQVEEPAIVGGYVEADDKNLTPELIEMFEKAFDGFVGASYTPVMLEATQVVAGTNYKFKADGTKTTNPIIQGTYYVYINKDLQGNISLLDIEVIEEHEIKKFEPEVKLDTEIKKDVTQMYFWIVFCDQNGNELQRTAEKYGTIPSFKGTLPEGFINWKYKKTGKDVTAFSPITTNTYFIAVCNTTSHKSSDPTPTPVIKYNVTAQVQGSHGTATVKVGDEEATTASQVLEGTSLVFEATPNDGYEFDYWEVVSGGVDIEAAKTTNLITVTMPGTALTLKAHFKAIVPSAYDIIVEDDGHGTASANPTSAAPGATVTLTATPNDGYAFKSWQIDRGLDSITGNSFTMPSNEVKVKAVFEKEYAVKVEAGGHGTVSADVAKGVSGKEVNLTITPDEGYKVDQITVVRGGVTVVDNKLNIGTADVKIRVTFKAIVPSTYGIIVEDDGHGTAMAQVGGADVTSAAPNATVTLVATANDGYAFKEWQIDRGLDSITSNSFTMPSNEVKVKAVFERVYNITLQTNEHGTASATVGGQTATTAAANAVVTLTAEPAEGYQFKEWKVVSGGVTVEDNKFTIPENNVTIQAVFEAKSQGCQYGDKGLGYAMCLIKQDGIFYAYYEYTDSQYSSPNFNILNGNYLPGITVGDYFHLVDDSIVTCNDGHGIELCKVTLAFDDTKGTTKFDQKEFYVPKGTEYFFNVDDSKLVIEGCGIDIIPNSGYKLATVSPTQKTSINSDITITIPFESSTPATTYTVTFDLNGISGTAPTSQAIKDGEKVTKPTDPKDTIHTFDGWYKTKDATTGSLSDPWDFDNGTVTANMTLYAQWKRTLESIYANSDIPKATNNTAPENAWVNGDGGKAFIAYSGKTSEVLYLYKKLETSGAKQLSCRKTEDFTKIGDDYVLDYCLNSAFLGKYTLHMTEGKFTSVTYNGAGTDYEVLSGTYTAPAVN